jgi:uncharacterized protein
MYETTIPFLQHSLKAMSAILAKAEAHCEAKKIDPAALLNFRIYPDMLPFTRQITLATDFAKGCGARLAGIPVPSFEDTEKTFPDLKARIAKTLDFLGSLKPEQFKDAAARTVTLKVAGNDMSMPAPEYFQGFAIPNFHFHLTTAYNILRHNGVEIGKFDYMGRGLK